MLVVADRQQRIRAAFEQLQVAGDRQARGFGLRLVEHLELDLLGATEHRFVLLEVRVQAAAVPQVADEALRVRDRAERVQRAAGLVELAAPAVVGAQRGQQRA